MDQKIFHGKITPQDFAQALLAEFHRGNLRVQQIGEGDKVAVELSPYDLTRGRITYRYK